MPSLSAQLHTLGETLRGHYRPSQYEEIILPLVLLRRLDCALSSQTRTSLDSCNKPIPSEPPISRLFDNQSSFNFKKLTEVPETIEASLICYLQGFPDSIQQLIQTLGFTQAIPQLNRAGLLHPLICQVYAINLDPEKVDTLQMGFIFEDLITQFNQSANEQTGDYFTPRETIHLMVNLLFSGEANSNGVKTLLDPTCGTGGMLSGATQYVAQHYPHICLKTYGQDFNPRAHAIAYADALLKGEESQVRFGDSLVNDQFKEKTFDYFLANPPFGIDWKAQHPLIIKEHKQLGYSGRFGAGTPRISDGSLLFVQHLVSKFKPSGSRCAIVLNGSPLFNGNAGSGESEIRRWLIEKDYLETIIALPNQIFQNTGIGTFIWILTNQKSDQRLGKIQLIDARERWHPLRRNVGEKRRYLDENDIQTILNDYRQFQTSETSKIFDNEDFGYRHITFERPLRLSFQLTEERKKAFLSKFPHLSTSLDRLEKTLGQQEYLDWNEVANQMPRWKNAEAKQFRQIFTEQHPDASPVLLNPSENHWSEPSGQLSLIAPPVLTDSQKDRWEADGELRDTENVPIKQDIETYFQLEVLPHVEDAWINKSKTCVGYEINVQRYFYKYVPPRPLEEITAEILALETEISGLVHSLI